MKSETAEIDIVERLRGLPIVVTENGRTGISRMGGALLSEAADKIEELTERVIVLRKIVQDQLNDIERLRKVVTLLIEYEEHDENIYKGAVMWEALIEAAHRALMEKE